MIHIFCHQDNTHTYISKHSNTSSVHFNTLVIYIYTYLNIKKYQKRYEKNHLPSCLTYSLAKALVARVKSPKLHSRHIVTY